MNPADDLGPVQAMAAQLAADYVRGQGPVKMCKRCHHRHRRRADCIGLRIIRPAATRGQEVTNTP